MTRASDQAVTVVPDSETAPPSDRQDAGAAAAAAAAESGGTAAVPGDGAPVAVPDDDLPFDLRASIARLQGEVRTAFERMTVPQLALIIGASLIGLGLAMLPPPIEIGHLMLGIGAITLVLTVALSSVASQGASVGASVGATTGEAHVVALIEGLDRKIEELKDTQWELSESEALYRDLLDVQDDVIIRRDAFGSLTYANRAFARVFGVDSEAAIGKPFRPVVHEGDAPEAQVFVQGDRRSYTQRIDTAQGARWYAWTEQVVTTAPDGGRQLQCEGRDITAERCAQHELARARDSAQAASRAKSRFLAVMSHEIRTPMNGILGMTSLLAETQQSAEQETYTRAIGQSAKTLLALIDEILDFSKIEAGKLKLRANTVVLDEVVQSVAELLAPQAHEKGLQVAWSVAADLPRALIGDEARIRQVLLNLVGNAVKFTERGGVIIELTRDLDAQPCAQDDHPGVIPLRICVTDTGIGIAPDAMASIFSEFEQLEPVRSRRHAGTGLGLAISRRLAEAMNGSVSAESRLGAGSVFTLKVRLTEANAATGAATTVGAVLAPLRSSKRVLLASDQIIEAQVMSAVLRSQGCTVEIATLAIARDRVAIAAAMKQPFDVLIVDAAADLVSAGAVLAQMREGNGSDARGIVTIKAVERDRLASFRKEGFAGFLVRPVRPASLLAQVAVSGQTRAELSRSGQEPNAPPPAPLALELAPAAGRAWHPRILLAEDNEIGALLANAMLDKCGCDVVRVRTGAEAVDAIRATLNPSTAATFDLVLMDVHMPDMDGLEATRLLRGLRSAGGAGQAAVPPIIALTANAFSEDRAQCIEAGMVDYLAKPFVKAELIALIEKWCRPVPLGQGHGAIDDGIGTHAAA